MADQPIVQPWTITPEQEQAFRATDQTFEWLCHLPPDILHHFAGKWVAARDSSIVASAKTYSELQAQLKNTDWQSVIIHWIERPARIIYQ